MRPSKRLISDRSIVAVPVAVAVAGLAFDNGGYGNVAVAIVAIAAWAGAGACAWVLRPGPPSRAVVLAAAALTGLLLLSVASMAWANDAGRAFAASERVAAYLGLFLLAVVTLPRSGPRPWLTGLAAGIAIVGAAALASRCDPALFGGGDRSLYASLPSAAGRLSYPVGYWNGLAAILAIGVVLSVWLSEAAQTLLTRCFAVALMPAAWLAIYLTSSRAGFAAAILGGLVVVGLGRNRASRAVGAGIGGLGGIALIALARGSSAFLAGADTAAARHYGLAVAAATLAVGLLAGVLRRVAEGRVAPDAMRLDRRLLAVLAVLAGLVAFVAADPATQLHEFERPDFSAPGLTAGQRPLLSASGSGRFQFWTAAVDAWESSPVHGVGAGNYELYWNAHPGGPVAIRNAHSLYLETLAELGPAGLALLLLFLLAAPVALWPRLRDRGSDELAVAAALLLAGLVSAAVEWTWQIPAALAPVIVGIAVLATAGPARERARVRSLGSRAAVAALVVLGWAVVWSGVVVLVSERSLADSRAAVDRGDLVAAAADARRAASLEPFSADPQIQLALVELDAKQTAPAQAAAARAVDLASGDWRTWFVSLEVAGVARDQGRIHASLAELRSLLPVPLGSLVRG
jgi:hypothetical protein